MPDLMRLMHRSFRQSKAPHLRALLASLERGIEMLNARGFSAGMELSSAREDALQEWASTYAIPAAESNDDTLRATIQETALTRNQTTTSAIETAIYQQVGVFASVSLSLPHVAFYDRLELGAKGFRMADYYHYEKEDVGILWGGAWDSNWPGIKETYTDDDPSHIGFRGLTPRREAFGPGGIIVYMGCAYDADLEEEVLSILSEQVPATKGYSIFWTHTFEATAKDTLRLSDHETTHPLHGWGCSPWGRFWGTPIVTAEACPDEAAG